MIGLICANCHHARVVACRRPYHYTECGLPNVTLVDVEVFMCETCGEPSPAICAVEELHGAIARVLIERPYRLEGLELQFLRAYLGYSSPAFAEVLGVCQETLSRWEHDRAPVNATADRLVRALVVVAKRQATQFDSFEPSELGSIDPIAPPRQPIVIQTQRSPWAERER